MENEVKGIREKCREKELFINKAGVQKELALKNAMENSLKTVRIVGIEKDKKTNKQVLEQTIGKLRESSGEGGFDFRGTRLHTSKNGKFSTVSLACHSMDQKLRVESQGRKAGLAFRQQLPSQLVSTCKDIREAYMKVESLKEGHLMVKFLSNHISVSHRLNFGCRWGLIETCSCLHPKEC